MRIPARDVALFLVCAAASAGGALAAARGWPVGGSSVLLLFGVVAALFAAQAAERRRVALVAEPGMGDVDVPGGVEIRAHRARYTIGGAALAAVGALAAALGRASMGAVVVAVALVAAGVAVAAASARGRIGFESVVFLPEGLRVRRGRASFLVPWDDLDAVRVDEASGNPVVLLTLKDTAALVRSIEAPDAAAQRRVAGSIGWAMAAHRCHVVLWPARYGVDALVFCAALRRCIDEPDRRAALRPREALGPSSHAPT